MGAPRASSGASDRSRDGRPEAMVLVLPPSAPRRCMLRFGEARSPRSPRRAAATTAAYIGRRRAMGGVLTLPRAPNSKQAEMTADQEHGAAPEPGDDVVAHDSGAAAQAALGEPGRPGLEL